MRSLWGTVVIFAVVVAAVSGAGAPAARAESNPALILSPTDRQALADARQLSGAGIGLSALGSAAGVSGLVMGSYSLLRDRLPDGVAPAAIGLSVAGPILVGVGVALLTAGRRLEREVRSEVRSDRKVAVGPGGLAVRF